MEHSYLLPVEDLTDLSCPCEDTWNIVKVGFGGDNCNTRTESFKGRKCQRVAYPKGSFAPSGRNQGHALGGVGFYACPKPVFPCTEAVLQYDVFFDRNFDPCKGGKLPGLYMSLCGADNFTGGSGGNKTSTTASCRVMWRGGMAAEAYVYRPEFQSAQYIALPSSIMNATYGDSLWRGEMAFRKGRWNTVCVHVRLNTIGKSDGLVSVAINGTTRAFCGMIWRTDPNVHITSVLFDTFFGGNSADYACKRDTTTRFSNVRVKEV